MKGHFIYLFILLLAIAGPGLAQTTSQSPTYNQVKEGVYYTQSKNFPFKGDTIVIAPQLEVAQLTQDIIYLKNRNKLWLFKNANPKSEADVAGILQSSTLATLLHTEYRAIYEEKKPYNIISFEVWHKVSINGQVYYIDIKPHRLGYQYQWASKKQTITLFQQYDGYDYSYDSGYPKHLLLMVFSKGGVFNLLSERETHFNPWDEFWTVEDGMKIKDNSSFLQIDLKAPGNAYWVRWNGQSFFDWGGFEEVKPKK